MIQCGDDSSVDSMRGSSGTGLRSKKRVKTTYSASETGRSVARFNRPSAAAARRRLPRRSASRRLMQRRPLPGERSNGERGSRKQVLVRGIGPGAPERDARRSSSLAFADHSRTLPAMSIAPYALIDPEAPAAPRARAFVVGRRQHEPGQQLDVVGRVRLVPVVHVGSSLPANAA